MKKALLWALAFAVLLCCSCVGLAEDTRNSIIIENLGDATEEELNSALQKIYAELQSRKESDILVDNEYITAKFLGFNEMPEMCFYVDLQITNKTDRAVWVILNEASVNDESMQLVGAGVPVTILPGQSGKGSFIFPYIQLSIASLSEVNEVKFRIKLLDDSTMDPITETESISIINQ